jgi:uncharacterized membrane protein YkoI
MRPCDSSHRPLIGDLCNRANQDRGGMRMKIERAKAAALESVGGGAVTEIEHQDGDGAGRFEVEVERPDGSQVEVYVDGSYDAVGSAGDDDSGAEDEGAGDDD